MTLNSASQQSASRTLSGWSSVCTAELFADVDIDANGSCCIDIESSTLDLSRSAATCVTLCCVSSLLNQSRCQQVLVVNAEELPRPVQVVAVVCNCAAGSHVIVMCLQLHECLAVMMLLAHVIVMCAMAGENQVLAGEAGAIDAVVAAMRAHVGNAGVSEQAKQCLALLKK